jgi:hypothetical protein
MNADKRTHFAYRRSSEVICGHSFSAVLGGASEAAYLPAIIAVLHASEAHDIPMPTG